MIDFWRINNRQGYYPYNDKAFDHLEDKIWDKGFRYNQIELETTIWAPSFKYYGTTNCIYLKNVEKLNMDMPNPSPRVVRSIDVEKGLFKQQQDGAEILGHKLQQLLAIWPTNAIGQESVISSDISRNHHNWYILEHSKLQYH